MIDSGCDGSELSGNKYYQHFGHGVFVVDVQVTLSVVGNHDASQSAVHPKV